MDDSFNIERLTRKERHEIEKRRRHIRFERGVYGVVKEPILPPHDFILHTHPRYYDSVRVPILLKLKDAEIKPDLRCFFLGVMTNSDRSVMDPLKNPWVGTREHLVPLRRDVPNTPHTSGGHGTVVWASNIANVTLGLAPLPVRLTIRRWLEETTYDRTDDSVAAGLNLRWLIIKYIDHFRILNRFPWSRRNDGKWWDDIQETFMQRAYAIEREFLQTRFEDRDRFIKHFRWQF